ncbi:unnamed protein product, partial [Aphanomyces euteiches]
NRGPRPPQHAWGDLAPQTAGGQDAIQHGGWLVPIAPQARQNVDVAAPIDVSQIIAEPAPPQNLDAAQPASVEVMDLVQENLKERNCFGKIVWKDIEWLNENHPSQIFGNPTAWRNSGITLRFLKYHFGDREGKRLPKVLLLWDEFSAHFTDE